MSQTPTAHVSPSPELSAAGWSVTCCVLLPVAEGPLETRTRGVRQDSDPGSRFRLRRRFRRSLRPAGHRAACTQGSWYLSPRPRARPAGCAPTPDAWPERCGGSCVHLLKLLSRGHHGAPLSPSSCAASVPGRGLRDPSTPSWPPGERRCLPSTGTLLGPMLRRRRGRGCPA